MIENILNGRPIQVNQAASPHRKTIIPANAMVNNLIESQSISASVKNLPFIAHRKESKDKPMVKMVQNSKMNPVTGTSQQPQTFAPSSYQNSTKKNSL